MAAARPKAQEQTQKRVQKEREKVQEIQEDNALENLTNVPDVSSGETIGETPRGKDKIISVDAVGGGNVIVSLGSESVTLDAEGVLSLQRQVRRATASL